MLNAPGSEHGGGQAHPTPLQIHFRSKALDSNFKKPSHLPSAAAGVPRHSPDPAAAPALSVGLPQVPSPWQHRGKRGQVYITPLSVAVS